MGSQLHTVDRALRVLLAFGPRRRELTVTELADVLDIHKSTASRLATTLARRGFLERDDASEAYRLGPELARIGLLALGRGNDLVAVAREPMERLAARSGETVNLAVPEPDGSGLVNVAQVEGTHIVGIGLWTGRWMPAHCTANGKALLAHRRDLVGQQAFTAYTERTITDPKALRRELAEVRRRGYASVRGEYEEGLHTVAAPIFDSQGCLGALSISAPSYRMPTRQMAQLGRLCRATADDISAHLGDGPAPAASDEP